MSEQAKVTSIDALEIFRASLIVFLADARRSLDEVGDAVRQTRQWLEVDQRMHWEGELKKRRRALEQAEQELFAARLSALRDDTSRQQLMVRRGREAVGEAEEKLRNVKKWRRDFDGTVEPMMKGLTGLRDFVDQDLVKAVSILTHAQKTLEAYKDISLAEPGGDAPATPAPETEPQP